MIKGKGSNPTTGEKLILLGLSAGNIDRLKKGQPILIDAKELGFDGKISIVYGETEEAIAAELEGASPRTASSTSSATSQH